MQKEEQGRGVKMGQRIGLSYCDELKIRKFYSEPGIEGGKKCKLWTSRQVNIQKNILPRKLIFSFSFRLSYL